MATNKRSAAKVSTAQPDAHITDIVPKDSGRSNKGSEPSEMRMPRPDRLPVDVPSVYADRVIDIIYGAYTSKVILGVETGSGSMRAVSVLVIPTAGLLIAAGNIIDNLTTSDVAAETSARVQGYLNMMKTMSVTTKDTDH